MDCWGAGRRGWTNGPADRDICDSAIKRDQEVFALVAAGEPSSLSVRLCESLRLLLGHALAVALGCGVDSRIARAAAGVAVTDQPGRPARLASSRRTGSAGGLSMPSPLVSVSLVCRPVCLPLLTPIACGKEASCPQRPPTRVPIAECQPDRPRASLRPPRRLGRFLAPADMPRVMARLLAT